MELKKKHRYLLSILSGVLMGISVPFTGGMFPLIFVAFIPLLLIEFNVANKKYKPGKVLIHGYISFLIYNVISLWWIWNADPGGAIFAWVANAFLMAFFFFFFHLTKRHVGKKEGYISFIVYWLGFEFFHYHWELSWPWINIGNVFSTAPSWVQWYDYSGVLGGTLWILILNLVGFSIVKNVLLKKETWRIQTPLIYSFLAILVIPLSISQIKYWTYEEVTDPMEVVVTQPNIDPYNGKFALNVEYQLQEILGVADELVTPNTSFVLSPETAIYRFGQFESQFTQTGDYEQCLNAVKKWNGTAFFTGISTLKWYDEKHSRASEYSTNERRFYESYNSSVLIDGKTKPSFVHKSKLVLGAEFIPFSDWFPYLNELALQNGGTTGTLGVEDGPKILESKGVKFAPVVCYESIYGDWVAQQCRLGAEVIFVITNDGWWGDSPGYKQHMAFSRLRALETRRYVARSANTGTSGFINQRGDVVGATDYWVKTGLRGTVQLNSEKTFYVEYGDVIGRAAGFVTILMLLFTLVKYIRKYTDPLKDK